MVILAQNYDELLKEHVKSGADITLLYHRVFDAKEGYSTCNALTLDGDKVKAVTPNLGDEDSKDMFMESYVMKKDLLLDLMFAARAGPLPSTHWPTLSTPSAVSWMSVLLSITASSLPSPAWRLTTRQTRL